MVAKKHRLDESDKVISFGEHVLSFNRWLLTSRPKFPDGVELLNPFKSTEVKRVNELFYRRFYHDTNDRYFLFGINPGRLGAGLTGIPFTDPVNLGLYAGIPNELPQKAELSSDFIYRMINALGGPDEFFRTFFMTAVCPLGFVKDGINMNYYDDKALLAAAEPFILKSIKRQLDFGCRREIAFIIGEGKNLDLFSRWNERYGFFKSLIGLSHPRFVMQYRRKQIASYIALYQSHLQPRMLE